jgi:hypothetical protein
LSFVFLSFVLFFFFCFFCLISFALLFFIAAGNESGQSQAEQALRAGTQSEAGRNAACGKMQTGVAPFGAGFLLRTAQDVTSQAAVRQVTQVTRKALGTEKTAVVEEIMVARVKKDGKKTPRSATKQQN